MLAESLDLVSLVSCFVLHDGIAQSFEATDTIHIAEVTIAGLLAKMEERITQHVVLLSL